MSITPVGVLTLLGLVIALSLREKDRGLSVMLGLTFPLTALPALVVAGNGFQSFYVVAVVVAIRLATSKNSTAPPLGGGYKFLCFALIIFFSASAILGPVVFEGTRVLVPTEGIDAQVSAPGVLEITVSNVAQAGYFVFGILTAIYLSRQKSAQATVFLVGTCFGTFLNLWAYLSTISSVPFPYTLVESLEGQDLTGLYGSGANDGMYRFRGIYSEPSSIATFSVPAIIFSIICLFTGQKRLLASILVVLNGWLVWQSASGTAVVGLVVSLAVLGVFALIKLCSRPRVHPAMPPLILAILCVLVLLGSRVYGFIFDIIRDKIGSTSFDNRSASNDFTWGILNDTHGLGVGLGSSRPSGFFYMLLSNVGVVGTVLFCVFVIITFRSGRRNLNILPARWALVALIIVKVVAAPDMSTPVLYVLIGICMAGCRQPVECRDDVFGSHSEALSRISQSMGEAAVRR